MSNSERMRRREEVITCLSIGMPCTVAHPEGNIIHAMNSPLDALAQRVDRLESFEAIRQLASKYALAIDVRDLDAVVSLYVADIRVGTQSGREALRDVFNHVLSQFRTTSHQVQNHVIELDGTHTAQGFVTCRCEHEVEVDGRWHWVVVQNLYHDRYERTEGHWYFKARVQNRVFSMVDGQPPLGQLKDRWPGRDAFEATFHLPFDSWREFWGEKPRSEALAEWTAQDNFVARLRRSKRLPSLAPHITRAQQEASEDPVSFPSPR